eukprot:TRINITY_DN27685_c0_g1_i1.p1 TRINITY_DN27685_c0_g1~~TRINITY_DN27685_c0_g1_i1.p1  ORF type:complete len:356 (+),score=30.54 TRINITY_DN27685_c0_g1_i1:2-1069(+)
MLRSAPIFLITVLVIACIKVGQTVNHESDKSETHDTIRYRPQRKVEFKGWNRWIVGGHYVTSSAANPLEMFSSKWNEQLINKEMKKIARLGMNGVKISLHEELYHLQGDFFLNKVDTLLSIAHIHGVSTMLVLCDSSGRSEIPSREDLKYELYSFKRFWPKSPYPGISSKRLRDFITAVFARFKSDPRILIWDLWERPSEDDLIDLALVFEIASGSNPTAPLTSSIDLSISTTHAVQAQQHLSDVISYHHSGGLPSLASLVKRFSAEGKATLCASYLTRSMNVTPVTALPIFKGNLTPSFTTGLIQGEASLTYTAASFFKPLGEEPYVWEHDVISANGVAHRYEEGLYIETLGLI